MTREQQAEWRDSVYAQSVADAEGPRVSIRAQFSNVSGSRRVRGIFNLQDDAYVLIGHIDADGVVRIVFPMEPSDEGFVNGGRSYQTHEFYAGFVSQYQYRAQTDRYRAATLARSFDSYDGGIGYLFVIASWRPMRFDQFQTNGKWDSFEMTDDEYLNDPRPAIYELASLLVGANREAYTVKFARYSNSQSLYGSDMSYSGLNSFSLCSGYGALGFDGSPSLFFSSAFFDYGSAYGFDPGYVGYSFTYRGSRYNYDSFRDCYRRAPLGGLGYYAIPPRIASNPPQNLPKRPFDPTGRQRPFNPRGFGEHPMPAPVSNAQGKGNNTNSTSANYRQRGLITSDEPVARGGRRDPHTEASAPIAGRTRPSIQDMVTRQPATPTDRGRFDAPVDRSSAQPRMQPESRSAPPASVPRSRPTYDAPARSTSDSRGNSDSRSRTETRGSDSRGSDSRGSSASSSPRMSPPPAASRPASPPPHESRPASPPPAASRPASPPPASSPPASRPADPPASSSSGGSSGRRPPP
jgi:hypothetical protein